MYRMVRWNKMEKAKGQNMINLNDDISHLTEALDKLQSNDPTQREYGLEMIRDEISYLKEQFAAVPRERPLKEQ